MSQITNVPLLEIPYKKTPFRITTKMPIFGLQKER